MAEFYRRPVPRRSRSLAAATTAALVAHAPAAASPKAQPLLTAEEQRAERLASTVSEPASLLDDESPTPSTGAQAPPPERASEATSGVTQRGGRAFEGSYFVRGEEEIVISGKRRRYLESKDILTSVDIVGQDQIRNESVDETLNLLQRLPGVHVEEFHQGIITSDLGVRGFNDHGDIAPLKLLIDGIPSNIHIGYADMKQIFPLDIARLELVRGTNDAREGLYAVAGSLHLFTRQGGNESIFRGTAGSFNTYEAQATSGVETDHFSQNLVGGFRYSKGYRDHSELSKVGLSGKWFYKLDDRLRVGLIARMFQIGADAPGYPTELDATAAPQSGPGYSQTDGGNQANRHLSVHFDSDLARNVFWLVKGYHQTFRRQRWVRFTAASTQWSVTRTKSRAAH